jgi:hypothetical protein
MRRQSEWRVWRGYCLAVGHDDRVCLVQHLASKMGVTSGTQHTTLESATEVTEYRLGVLIQFTVTLGIKSPPLPPCITPSHPKTGPEP